MNNKPIPPEQPDYKLDLLAASHAHFVKSAELLYPILNDMPEPPWTRGAEIWEEGMDLLQEAMELHEKYMKACK